VPARNSYVKYFPKVFWLLIYPAEKNGKTNTDFNKYVSRTGGN
jgi:hypothetical protein